MNKEVHRGFCPQHSAAVGVKGQGKRVLGPQVYLNLPRLLSSLSVNGTLKRDGVSSGAFQWPHGLPEGGGRWSPQTEAGLTTSPRLKSSPPLNTHPWLPIWRLENMTQFLFPRGLEPATVPSRGGPAL